MAGPKVVFFLFMPTGWVSVVRTLSSGGDLTQSERSCLAVDEEWEKRVTGLVAFWQGKLVNLLKPHRTALGTGAYVRAENAVETGHFGSLGEFGRKGPGHAELSDVCCPANISVYI